MPKGEHLLSRYLLVSPGTGSPQLGCPADPLCGMHNRKVSLGDYSMPVCTCLDWYSKRHTTEGERCLHTARIPFKHSLFETQPCCVARAVQEFLIPLLQLPKCWDNQPSIFKICWRLTHDIKAKSGAETLVSNLTWSLKVPTKSNKDIQGLAVN